MESEVLLEAMIPRVRSLKLTSAPKRRLNNTLHALASLPVEIEPA
jgi:4-methoxybenzoate monooxygenase (O-demethylating)